MKAECVGWGFLLLVLVYLLWCWYSYHHTQASDSTQHYDDGVDFSIYLYSSKRGQGARLDD